MADTDGGGTTVDRRPPLMDGAVSITTSTWSASADLLPEACFFAAPCRGVGGAAEVRAEGRAEARNDSRGNWIACQRPDTIRHLAIPLVSPRAARATRCVGIAASLLGPAIEEETQRTHWLGAT